jgi:organic hydroperoxide reductase OsmC/OhrA
VTAAADAAGEVTLETPGVATLRSAPPIEFGGPGDRWSPETMLVAAVVDCFVLTFRSIATASKLSWMSLACEATGTLDRVERVTQFTAFEVRARLRIPPDGNEEQAQRVLERAETMCLVTNSLKAPSHLEASVEVMALR